MPRLVQVMLEHRLFVRGLTDTVAYIVAATYEGRFLHGTREPDRHTYPYCQLKILH